MARILVTGGSGFLGRHLCPLLRAAGHELLVTGLRAQDGVQALDLCQAQASADLLQQWQPEVIAHLAAQAFVGHGSEEDFYRINVLATDHLLKAACRLPTPPYVLVCSSANVYGAATQTCLDEDCEPHPINHYAISKRAMEYRLQAYAGQLAIAVVRPFNFTGPGQSPDFLVAKLVHHFAQRSPSVRLGNLQVARDFSDVRDVAAACARLIAGGHRGLYNIASGTATSLAEIWEMLVALCAHRPQIIVDPALVRTDEIPSLCGNAARLQAQTGWRRHYTLTQTLADMLAAERS